MSEHNLIQSMTNEELRRELAERLGWYVRPFAFGFEAAIERDGRIFTVGCADSVDQAWEVAMLAEHGIPDWPNSIGASLELCKSIAPRIDCRLLVDWEYSPPDDPELEVSFVEMWYSDDARGLRIEPKYEAQADTEARALSELAAEALRRLTGGGTT